VAARSQSRVDTNPQYRLLLVADLGGWIDRMFPIQHGRVYRTEPLIAASWRLQPDPPVDEVVIYHRGGAAADDLETAMKNVAGALKPGGRLTVLCHYPIYRDVDGEDVGRDRLSFTVAPFIQKGVTAHFAGGARALYARALLRYAHRLRHGSLAVRARAALGLVWALARALMRPRSALLHAAWVFTARKWDLDAD
jgi:hypothetical protein